MISYRARNTDSGWMDNLIIANFQNNISIYSQCELIQPGTKGPGGLSILPLSRSVSDPTEFVGCPHFLQVHSPHTWQNQGWRPFNNSLCALCRVVFVHLSFSPHTTRYLFDTSSNLTD